MSWPPPPLAFHIVRHAHLPGVRLSLRRDFVNLPFPDDAAAEAEARRIAGTKPFTIERAAYRALPSLGARAHD